MSSQFRHTSTILVFVSPQSKLRQDFSTGSSFGRWSQNEGVGMQVLKGRKVKRCAIKDAAETRVPPRIIHYIGQSPLTPRGTNCPALPRPTLAESITELAGIRGAQAYDWGSKRACQWALWSFLQGDRGRHITPCAGTPPQSPFTVSCKITCWPWLWRLPSCLHPQLSCRLFSPALWIPHRSQVPLSSPVQSGSLCSDAWVLAGSQALWLSFYPK